VPPPYAAYLRVYEPLAAFPPAEQESWRAYVAAGRAPSPAVGPAIERAAGLASLFTAGPPKLEEQAFVAEHDGSPVVCPWRTQLRAWEAIVAWRSGMAEVLADAFVPRALADAAQADLAAWRAEHPDARSHIRSQTWSVPVRWFVLFDPRERRCSIDGDRRALAYRTPMVQARRRAARALVVLRKVTGETSAVSQAVEEMARWLEEFHPRSLVELDYGGLAELFSAADLQDDDSAADVAAALGGLTTGDTDAAGTSYERVIDRWRPIQSVETAN
jgi:hypothetical protein